jgi:trk system potassium uptake protein TrkH
MGSLAVVGLIGRLVLLFALLMVLPLAFALGRHDAAEGAFSASILVTLVAGVAMSGSTARYRRELQPRDGFLLVGLTWLVLPFFGAMPLWLALPELSATDAYFEAMSAFTATGATVLKGLDDLPLSVNLWRCFMQLVGGVGIFVLAVAILPTLGVGGSQLFRAEITGPIKDQKLTPRIADTARAIWVIYVLLAAGCTLGYRWAGMSWEDAFMHMCATISLGGFSSYDASLGHWDSLRIEAVGVLFMLLAGINLTLYFVAWRQRSVAALWGSVEARAFYGTLLVSILGLTLYLLATGAYAGEDVAVALRHVVFSVVSVATTTGFSSYDYGQWPAFASLLIVMMGCFATCAGSTGGGIKMIRLIILFAQARRELVRIIHPRSVSPLVIGGRTVEESTIQGVLAFMMIYGVTIFVLTMVLLFTGLDPVTAFTAVVACVNNIGPGLGEVGPAGNYQGLTDFQTWVCTFAMLLGRLEMLTLLVMMTGSFWRR